MEKVVLQYIISWLGDFSYRSGVTLYTLALTIIVQDIDSKKLLEQHTCWHYVFFCITVELMILLSIWATPAENSIIPHNTKIMILIVLYGSLLWLLGVVYTFFLAIKYAKNDDIRILMCAANAIFLFLLFLSLHI